MTHEQIQKSFSHISTQELLEIIDNKFDYTELAVTTAINELSTRKVSEADISAYKEEQLQRAKAFIRKNVLNDLSVAQKNFFYFLWLPVLHLRFKQNFKEGGYVLKLKQANYYALLGFIFFTAAVFICMKYNFTAWTLLAFWIIGFVPVYAFDESVNRKAQINKLKSLYGNQKKERQLKETDEKKSS